MNKKQRRKLAKREKKEKRHQERRRENVKGMREMMEKFTHAVKRYEEEAKKILY